MHNAHPTTRLVGTTFDLAHSMLAAGELAAASGSVIAQRSALIGAAIADPAGADNAEFARMAPEKVRALGRAATVATSHWWDWHRVWLGYAAAEARHAMQSVAELALTPNPMRLLEVQTTYVSGVLDRAAHHGATIAAAALAAADATISPIHRRAMSNARRLAKRSRR